MNHGKQSEGSGSAGEHSIVDREVVSEPGSAVQLIKLKLSPEAKSGLNAGRVALSAVTHDQGDQSDDR